MRFTWADSALTDDQSFTILKAALTAGVNVWNGAGFYGTPENNSLHLMQRYFSIYPEDAEKVVLTIKSGIRDINPVTLDASPSFLRQQVATANRILAGTKKIDLFGPGRIDKNVPVEKTVKALAEMVAEGQIGGIQLSEVNPETIRLASAVAKIDMVETEINMWAMQVFQNGVADICAELDIVMAGHTPLSAGMLTRKVKGIEELAVPAYYRQLPKFQPENLRKNYELITALETLTTAKGKPGMPVIIPVSGASSVERAVENSKDVELTEEGLEEVDAILSSFTGK
ncbi:putative aldo/keto reductase [Dactylonectria macrodidyma]|uniref:Aldo/keto reductase n=1 Tax=Dactylonectria macrodidyma TaxID=307937 RepID=A0A9P9DRM1_9HYPO|nr:putative aldo/keto reductase [Dactylonectria macrodidyma]